jgi:hypothetical protein
MQPQYEVLICFLALIALDLGYDRLPGATTSNALWAVMVVLWAVLSWAFYGIGVAAAATIFFAVFFGVRVAYRQFRKK